MLGIFRKLALLYGVLRFARLLPSFSFSLIAPDILLSFSLASICAGLKRVERCVVDALADSACVEFFFGCILEFLQ